MMSGISELPPIRGYVLTSKKENPLVETVLLATKPGGEDNTTILAGWNYGLGRAVAFTTDAGLQWTPDWAGSPAADKLFAQIVRWSMRPSGGSGRLTATFEPLEGKMRVVVTALDDKNEFLNFLTMTGTAVGPDLKKPLDLEIEQTAPGRYVGTFPVREAGSYFVTINPGRGMAPLRTGVNVPYSDEFRDRGANDALLTQLAAVQPKDGPPGQLIENPAEPDVGGKLLEFNTFRHDLPKATSSQEAWHWLVLMASLRLPGRRVHPPRERELRLAAAAVGPAPRFRPPPPARAGPAAIHRASEEPQGGSGRAPGATPRGDAVRAAHASAGRREAARMNWRRPRLPAAATGPSLAPEKKEEETYTERLLKAKKKAWEERKESK